MLYGIKDIIRDLVGLPLESGILRSEEFWSLRDLSFSVNPGECIGVVGFNGVGKSTLLKLISGIMLPDVGRIQVARRIGTLIEIGAGFHPMLSGRENIYVNGAILGLKKQEIQQKLDEIIAFSGLEEFIDSPVKHYSSGMYVRLGFSIAVHTSPDVLLVDEALSVGDAAFRIKCLNKIESVKEQGTAILFVSHSEPQVSRVADLCLLLHNHRIAAFDTPHEVLRVYRTLRANADSIPQAPLSKDLAEYQSEVQILSVEVAGPNGTNTAYTGELLKITVDYETSKEIKGVCVELRFWSSNELLVAVIDSAIKGRQFDLSPGKGHIQIEISDLVVTPDYYRIAGGFYANNQIVAWGTKLTYIEVKTRLSCPSTGMVLIHAEYRQISRALPDKETESNKPVSGDKRGACS
jgi:ABC-type polysaccharide/polyol phosphate transport system ATPase subunit